MLIKIIRQYNGCKKKSKRVGKTPPTTLFGGGLPTPSLFLHFWGRFANPPGWQTAPKNVHALHM